MSLRFPSSPRSPFAFGAPKMTAGQIAAALANVSVYQTIQDAINVAQVSGDYIEGMTYRAQASTIGIGTAITVAQIGNSFTTPIIMTPGQAGATLVPYVWMYQQLMGGVLWSVGPTINLRYQNGTQALCGAIQIGNTASLRQFYRGQPNTIDGADGFDATGKGLEMAATADRTGGSGDYIFTVLFTAVIGL